MLKGVASARFIRHANNPARDECQRAEMQTRTVLDTMKKLQWKEVAVKFIYKTVELAQVLAKENPITGLFFSLSQLLYSSRFTPFFPAIFSSVHAISVFYLSFSYLILFLFFFFFHTQVYFFVTKSVLCSRFFLFCFFHFRFVLFLVQSHALETRNFFLFLFVLNERTTSVLEGVEADSIGLVSRTVAASAIISLL